MCVHCLSPHLAGGAVRKRTLAQENAGRAAVRAGLHVEGLGGLQSGVVQ